MKLYQAPPAPNPRRVRIFLAEKGIDVPMVSVNIIEGENLSTDHRKVNPAGVLPALELDDGTCISESMAICRYFEELQPEPALMGRDALEKAVVEMWSRRCEFECLQRASGVFRNTWDGFAGRSVAGFPEPTEQIPALAEQSRMVLNNFGDTLDKRLGESEYIAGDGFSVADITGLCAVDFAEKRAQVPIREGHANVSRWYDAVNARPSAQA